MNRLFRQKKIFFLIKAKNSSHSSVNFNKNYIKKYTHWKHFSIALEEKVDFKFHVDQKILKICKLIGLIRRLSVNVPRKALLTIYKSFIRLHLDYGDVSYDTPKNENFQNKLEKVQYRAWLAVTVAKHQVKNITTN